MEPRRSRSFTYDQLQRLNKVEEPRPNPTPPVTAESYDLDAEGNRVASHRSAFHVTAQANRLIEDEQYNYEYDIDGNLIRKGIKASGKEWRYGYDDYDRLIAAGLYPSAGASTAEKAKFYEYDAFDRRVAAFDVTVSGVSTSTRSVFTLHDDWNVLVQQENAQGSAGPASSKSRRWFTQGGEDDIAAITANAPGVPKPLKIFVGARGFEPPTD